MTHPTPRLGFALLTTLLAILLTSALITTTALLVDEDGRTARAATLHSRAIASAEGAAWSTFVSINAQTFRTAPIGLISQALSSEGELTKKVTVTKLDTSLVWIVAESHIQQGREAASHRIGLRGLLPHDTIDTHLSPLPGAAWADLY